LGAIQVSIAEPENQEKRAEDKRDMISLTTAAQLISAVSNQRQLTLAA